MSPSPEHDRRFWRRPRRVAPEVSSIGSIGVSWACSAGIDGRWVVVGLVEAQGIDHSDSKRVGFGKMRVSLVWEKGVLDLEKRRDRRCGATWML